MMSYESGQVGNEAALSKLHHVQQFFIFEDMSMDDVKWMKEAIKQAKKAESYDEVPIGCVIVKDDKVIARGYNKRETLQQSIAHAEIMAIQKACKKLNTWRLED